MDKQIQDRIDRWDALLTARAPYRSVFMIPYSRMYARPIPVEQNIDERLDWAKRRYDEQIDQLRWLDDDMVPSLHLYTGTEIYAEAFGCAIHYPEDNMPFALPLVHDLREASRIAVPDIDSCKLGMLLEMAGKLKAYAGDNAILQLPDVQSPFGIAAQIWNKSDFFIAMIDEPEAVLELVDKTTTLVRRFFDAWFRQFGRDYVAHHPYYPMRGGLTLSEDEAGSISTDSFDTYSLPSLDALSRHFGGLGMHCCARSRHQWPGFRKITGLRLLNLDQPVDVLKDAYAFFGDQVCHQHVDTSTNQAWTTPDQNRPGDRIVYEVRAQDREDAIRQAYAVKTRLNETRKEWSERHAPEGMLREK